MATEIGRDDWEIDFSATVNDDRSPEMFVDFGDADDNAVGLNDEGPEAMFDALFLVAALERHNAPGRLELHNFAYLACLMSVYSGEPASNWGYSFSAVPPTLPFSPALEGGLRDLESAGYISSRASSTSHSDNSEDGLAAATQYYTTADGNDELAFLSSLLSFKDRLRFLKAASSTAVLLSLHAVVSSMTLEPELLRATQTSTNRILLRTRGRGPLYEQFAALRQVLGPEHRDLVVPASLFVRFLNEQAQRLMESLDD